MIFPIIIIVLFFFAAMIVLQWGLDITGRNRFAAASEAGVINGEKVSWDAYQNVYSNMYQEAASQADDELPDSKIQELENAAWMQLVQDRLLMQEAARHNIVITEDDLYLYLRLSPPLYLQQYPLFQTEGQFDYQKYLGAMADPQWAPFWVSVEPQTRAELRKAKMQQLIIEAANITESEVRQAFLDTEEQVTVKMITVNHRRFSGKLPEFTDEDLSAYFEENSDKYTLDERVKLDIVMVNKEPSDADWETARTRAGEIYDSVMAGADFDLLARTYSDDPGSARKGGDLGWFEQGRMVPEFDSLSFSMKEGDISEPVKTQFGWHILKHQGYREQETREAHVFHILIKAKPSQKTLDEAFGSLEQFLAIAIEHGFEQASTETELEVKTTRSIFRDRPIDIIGTDDVASQFAFGSEAGAISEVMENDRGFYVLKVNSKVPEGPGEFDEVKTRVRQDLNRTTMASYCQDTANAAYAEIQNGATFQEAAEKHGEEVKEPAPISRTGSFAGVGRAPAAVGAAFSLTEVGQISPVVDYPNGSVIFSLVDRTTPDLSSFNEKRDSIFSEVMLAKQQQLYSRWFSQLIENSEIINNVERQRQLSGSSM